jgi:hypothetical protein
MLSTARFWGWHMAHLAKVSAVLLMGLVSSFTAAQTSATEKSGAAEKLNYFVGTWSLEVHLKIGPLGSRAFFGTEHNEWMPGGLLLMSRQEGETAVPSAGLVVLAYNTQKKAYTYHVVKDTGDTEDLSGTLEDHRWTWTSFTTPGKQVARSRLIVQEISPTSYSLKFETAEEGHDWSTVMEGNAVKILPHARQDVAFLR